MDVLSSAGPPPSAPHRASRSRHSKSANIPQLSPRQARPVLRFRRLDSLCAHIFTLVVPIVFSLPHVLNITCGTLRAPPYCRLPYSAPPPSPLPSSRGIVGRFLPVPLLRCRFSILCLPRGLLVCGACSALPLSGRLAFLRQDSLCAHIAVPFFRHPAGSFFFTMPAGRFAPAFTAQMFAYVRVNPLVVGWPFVVRSAFRPPQRQAKSQSTTDGVPSWLSPATSRRAHAPLSLSGQPLLSHRTASKPSSNCSLAYALFLRDAVAARLTATLCALFSAASFDLSRCLSNCNGGCLDYARRRLLASKVKAARRADRFSTLRVSIGASVLPSPVSGEGKWWIIS